MLSHKLVLLESKNFTSGLAILAPPTIPINHYFGSRNQQNRETRAVRSMLLRRQLQRQETSSKIPERQHRNTQTHRWCRSPILLFHAGLFNDNHACLKHSNFFKVNDQDPYTDQMNGSIIFLKDDRRTSPQSVIFQRSFCASQRALKGAKLPSDRR